jgi:para-aminobenzoate synthetase component 1
MHEIDASADEMVTALLRQPEGRNIALLDSCGVGRAGSNRLIAGIDPIATVRLDDDQPDDVLREVDRLLDSERLAAIFTMSYDFGLALSDIIPRNGKQPDEPFVFVALFDCLAVHNYDHGQTWLAGGNAAVKRFERSLGDLATDRPDVQPLDTRAVTPTSNFTRTEYLNAIEQIKDLIREGETYQANLTQQLSVTLADGVTPENVFLNLRRDHPAAFAAYIDRGHSTVVSASPELFVRSEADDRNRTITASPIKGTRPRGSDAAEDERFLQELLASEKDRAENTMIVDLMRNDLGRVCDFGSVAVDELCRLEAHPTLFHLVSTVTGKLRSDVRYSDIIRATFPCGSITGAPKIRTMEIIERLETAPRGLSMGAIGCRIPGGRFGTKEIFEMSVAIRTMIVRDRTAVFNVGGGIVIDSDPLSEYDESMLKAKALLNALGSIGIPRSRAVSPK